IKARKFTAEVRRQGESFGVSLSGMPKFASYAEASAISTEIASVAKEARRAEALRPDAPIAVTRELLADVLPRGLLPEYLAGFAGPATIYSFQFRVDEAPPRLLSCHYILANDGSFAVCHPCKRWRKPSGDPYSYRMMVPAAPPP